MNKEEKIQDVYESLGFEWEVCSKYITENGVIILPTPDLKYTLKGYNNLIKDTDKFSAFGNEGLKIQPSILAGIYNNNGWIKIESEENLPKERCAVWTFITEKEVVMNTFNTFDDMEFTFDNGKVTHYQPIIKPKPPIY